MAVNPITRLLATVLQRYPLHVIALPAKGSRRVNAKKSAQIRGDCPDEWAKNFRSSGKIDPDVFLLVRIPNVVWEAVKRADKASRGAE